MRAPRGTPLVVSQGPAKLASSTAVLAAFFAGVYLTSFLLRGIAAVLGLSLNSLAEVVLDTSSQ